MLTRWSPAGHVPVSPLPVGHTHPAETFDAVHVAEQQLFVKHERKSKQPGRPLQLWSSASQQFSFASGSTSPGQLFGHFPFAQVCVPSLQMPVFSVPDGPS